MPGARPGPGPGVTSGPGRTHLAPARPWLRTVLREWGRIGCIGFGGPPAHIKLLRDLCVERREWLDAQEFEDAIAACNLLPGPASTQLAIFCAWRLRGRPGRAGRRGRVHRARADRHPGPGRAVPGRLAAALGARRRRGRRGRRPGGRGPGGHRPCCGASWQRRRQTRPLAGLPGRRGRRGGHPRALAGAGPARLRGDRAGGAAGRSQGAGAPGGGAAGQDGSRAPGSGTRWPAPLPPRCWRPARSAAGCCCRWPGSRSRSGRCPTAAGS